MRENTEQSVISHNYDQDSSLSTISEKQYPITVLWIFKAPIIVVLVNAVALFFGYYFPLLVILFPFYLISNPLVRGRFHYRLEDKFFYVKNGVISKKERHIPYGVIQNVFVKQDLFDRIFGLATLRLENAVTAGDVKKKGFWGRSRATGRGVADNEVVGSIDNAVNIPGMRKKHAEELKDLILQKLVENPNQDTRSGL